MIRRAHLSNADLRNTSNDDARRRADEVITERERERATRAMQGQPISRILSNVRRRSQDSPIEMNDMLAFYDAKDRQREEADGLNEETGQDAESQEEDEREAEEEHSEHGETVASQRGERFEIEVGPEMRAEEEERQARDRREAIRREDSNTEDEPDYETRSEPEREERINSTECYIASARSTRHQMQPGKMRHCKP
jgi:hypothetical protein